MRPTPAKRSTTPLPPAVDRGDVPGWVLITMMTAGLVVIIWGLAGPALSNLFTEAMHRLTSM